jgi:hypothetical protein
VLSVIAVVGIGKGHIMARPLRIEYPGVVDTMMAR